MNTSRNIDPTRTTFMETARDPDKYEEFRRASGLPDCGFKRYHICTDHFPPEDVFLKKGVPVRRGVMPSIRMEWTEEDLQQWKGMRVIPLFGSNMGWVRSGGPQNLPLMLGRTLLKHEVFLLSSVMNN